MDNTQPPIEVYVEGKLVIKGWGIIRTQEGKYSHIIKIENLPYEKIELPIDSWEKK